MRPDPGGGAGGEGSGTSAERNRWETDREGLARAAPARAAACLRRGHGGPAPGRALTHVGHRSADGQLRARLDKHPDRVAADTPPPPPRSHPRAPPPAGTPHPAPLPDPGLCARPPPLPFRAARPPLTSPAAAAALAGLWVPRGPAAQRRSGARALPRRSALRRRAVASGARRASKDSVVRTP